MNCEKNSRGKDIRTKSWTIIRACRVMERTKTLCKHRLRARATRHAMAFLGILWAFLFFLVCDPLDMTQSETGEVFDSRDAATISKVSKVSIQRRLLRWLICLAEEQSIHLDLVDWFRSRGPEFLVCWLSELQLLVQLVFNIFQFPFKIPLNFYRYILERGWGE